MGWHGHGIYDGDETQTQHYIFLKLAGITLNEEEENSLLGRRKTTIPKQYIPLFKKNLPKVIAKMHKKKVESWDEYDSIEWQMLMCLLMDNKIKMPATVKKNGIIATEKLLYDGYADEFDEPSKRKAALKRLLKKALRY